MIDDVNDDYLECPCCGDVALEPDEAGRYEDGARTTCGCPGLIAIDEDGYAFVMGLDDEECPRCSKEEKERDERGA